MERTYEDTRNGIRLFICENENTLPRFLAEFVLHTARSACAEKGLFSVALSGGSALSLFSGGLVLPPYRKMIDWNRWRVFFADERMLPENDPENIYASAKQLFFNLVSLPEGNIHPMDPRRGPERCAESYEKTLRGFFGETTPRFDMVLLGIGEDGHTASLFPGRSSLDERERWVVPEFDSPKSPSERATLTIPVLRNAVDVVFATIGEGKSKILAEILGRDGKGNDLPASLVARLSARCSWFADRAALHVLEKKGRLEETLSESVSILFDERGRLS